MCHLAVTLTVLTGPPAALLVATVALEKLGVALGEEEQFQVGSQHLRTSNRNAMVKYLKK